MSETKTCTECGEPFVQQNHVSAIQFKKQLTCSRRCGSRRVARLKRRDQVALPQVPGINHPAIYQFLRMPA